MATSNYQGELDTQYLTLGEALPLDMTWTAVSPAVAPDWDELDCTVHFDGPTQADGSDGVRNTYQWRPGGSSDPEFSLVSDVLRLTIPAADIVDDFYQGKWVVSVCVNPPATTQDELGAFYLYIVKRPRGALPVA